DHRTVGVGDGDDRVAEGALDVSLPVGHVLLVLAAHLPGAGRATALGGHAVSPDGGSRYGLLAGLLLAGHGALGALAGARVGLGALAAHREAAAVTQALVAADLDLAADVGRDLTAQVTLEAVVALEVVTQLHQLLVRQVLHPGVGAHARRLERLHGAGAAHAEDVGEGDLDALVAREVDSDESCHVACAPVVSRRSGAPPFR